MIVRYILEITVGHFLLLFGSILVLVGLSARVLGQKQFGILNDIIQPIGIAFGIVLFVMGMVVSFVRFI